MEKVLLIYLAIISVISICITCFDKHSAIVHGRRTPEKTLILFALCGGALPMFVTMQIIRHKTKHTKFMVGLPLMIILHAGIAALIVFVR